MSKHSFNWCVSSMEDSGYGLRNGGVINVGVGLQPETETGSDTGKGGGPENTTGPNGHGSRNGSLGLGRNGKGV
jgi:hypothetical protein